MGGGIVPLGVRKVVEFNINEAENQNIVFLGLVRC